LRSNCTERCLKNSFVETSGQWPFFRDVGIASADRSHDFTRQFSAAIAKCGVPFPAVIEMSGKEAVEVIGETLFKLFAPHGRVRHCFLKNASFKFP
jgi:hypothetical protein